MDGAKSASKTHTNLAVRCYPHLFQTIQNAFSLPHPKAVAVHLTVTFVSYSVHTACRYLGPFHPTQHYLLGARHETEAFDGGPDFRRRWRKARICCSRRRPGSADL